MPFHFHWAWIHYGLERKYVRLITGAKEKAARISGWIRDCRATWNAIIFLSGLRRDVIVFLYDNWPPPPRSLQCCSLLNYYQWVWRDTFLSLSHMTFSLSHSRVCVCVCVQTLGLYLIWRAFWMGVLQKQRDLYCAVVSGAGRGFHVNVHAWWELHCNTGTDLHTDTHECICDQGAQRNTDAFAVAFISRTVCLLVYSLFSLLPLNKEIRGTWLFHASLMEARTEADGCCVTV